MRPPNNDDTALKNCLVICQIGEPGSPERKRSDQILTHIIKPIARELGYAAIRADEMTSPGMITSQIIQRVIADDLVIADLTGKNANVFYELAVRHAVRKPIVTLIEQGQTIPFDVSQSRAIPLDVRDLDSVERCKVLLRKHIHEAEAGSEDSDNPITTSVDLQSLRSSDDPQQQQLAHVVSALQRVEGLFRNLDARMYVLSQGLEKAAMPRDWTVGLPERLYQANTLSAGTLGGVFGINPNVVGISPDLDTLRVPGVNPPESSKDPG